MAAAEITRDETAARARLLQVDSYQVDLDLTRGPEIFGSVSRIRFGCAEPGAASYLDLIADRVHEITLNGNAVDPAAAWADGRIALTGLAARNELVVVADCRYSRDGTGLHRAVDPADGKVYCYTKFEPAYARRVYANFEQPDLKASFSTSVTVPGHWTVLANEPLAGTVAAGQDKVTWRFQPTPRLSTYLFAIAAGEYEVVRSTHTTPDGQVIPLGLACRASMAAFQAAEDIFACTRLGLDYYTRLFATPYPFAKYDQVFVPEYSVGATENAGCVVFTDQLLFRAEVTDTLHEIRASVILHEMAHMWFGDLVTMKWWDDLWLNESFAEFSAALASAEATRFSGSWATFAGGREAWGYAADQLPTTHPVAASVGTLTEAIANFDGISYSKGAAVLRQLVARIGRESFFAGISAYFAEFGWSNATLADWLRALETSSGQSLADWSRAWLQSAGPSTLRSEFDTDGQGRFTSFAVLQSAPPQHPVLRPHRLAIGFYHRADGALRRTSQVLADIDGPRTEIAGLAGVAQPDLILLNDDDLTYAITRFDPRSVATLTTSIGELADPLARAVCWTAVLDMVSQAELPVPDYVAMVAAGLDTEPSVAALQIVLENCRSVLQRQADPAWVSRGKDLLAGRAAVLLQDAAPGSDHQLAWAQLLAWSATSAPQLDLIAALLDGSAALPGLTADQELRWAMLERLAAAGRAGDQQIDAELARDKTDSGAREAATCRAAIGDDSHKAAAWQLLTDPATMNSDLLRGLSGAFYQPEQASVLAPYAARYFEVLPRIWSNSLGHLQLALASALFPRTAASAGLLRELDEFLTAQEREPGLVRVLTECRDQVERALRSRALGGSGG
jgi:aminopeptidase N